MLGPQDFTREWVNPPTRDQVHAPSVVAGPAGPIAAWFQGQHEGSPDTRIYLSRDHGGGWSDPVVLHPAPTPHWNPVLTRVPNGDVWLYFKRGETISSWRTWYSITSDGGRTWSEAAPLPGGEEPGGRGPVKNPPVYLPDAWIAPGSTETWGDAPVWEPFVDITRDGGTTWHKVPIPVDRTRLRGAGLIQPALWRGSDERTVHALMRSTEGTAYHSTSLDGGRTWSTAQPSALPNNNSGLAVAPVLPGLLITVYNPVTGDWAPRCPLAVAQSTDDGTTWRRIGTVEDGQVPIDEDPEHQPVRPDLADAPRGADTGVITSGRGEYSYPAIALDGDRLTICYTWQRRRIVCARLARETLRQISNTKKA